MAHTALTVAKYFISRQDRSAGDLLSHLKLQKLMYYAQGYWVGHFGVEQPLFNESIQAWKHGPVVKSVYHEYSKYSNKPIPHIDRPLALTETTGKYLDEIYRTKGKYSAWALREQTHREAPWLDNFQPNVTNKVIPLEDIHAFFAPLVAVA